MEFVLSHIFMWECGCYVFKLFIWPNKLKFQNISKAYINPEVFLLYLVLNKLEPTFTVDYFIQNDFKGDVGDQIFDSNLASQGGAVWIRIQDSKSTILI